MMTKAQAKKSFRWTMVLGGFCALGLWAGSSDFTASPSQGAPPVGGNAFAGAAGAAGFSKPAVPIDVSQFSVENTLPPLTPLVSIHRLAGFPFEGDYEDQTDAFAEPKKRLHPKRKIPASILALNGKKVAICGFMLPFDYHARGTGHFGLLKSQAGCCFGLAPQLNEWIDVHMDKEAKLLMDTPVLVVGTLKVAEIREYGNLMGVYRMEGVSVEKAIIPELDDSLTGPLQKN